MKVTISEATSLTGSPFIPGDKSISHRAVLFGGLAKGTTEIRGLSDGEDVRSTRRCFEAMGIEVREKDGAIFVKGNGLRGLKVPAGSLDCGNSGTTIRMLMGVLAGQSFTSTMVGDASLSRRPMGRVADPLKTMGADITLTGGKFAPLTVKGVGRLKPIEYRLEVASAQVKSAVLLAGLYADGITRVTGEIRSRDHTERLLPHFGVGVEAKDTFVSIKGGQELHGAKVSVPGDPSSAAFWLAAACVVPKGRISIENLLLNPTRTGFIQALKRMGADVTETLSGSGPEPVGAVQVTGGSLRGITITPDEVPSLIDELPVLAVLAAYADGVTEVRGAEELRVKETDRIEAVAENLRRMGGKIETFADGFRIEGRQALHGASVESFHDHRIAMAFAVAALGAKGKTEIEGAEAVSISYPSFFATLERLTGG